MTRWCIFLLLFFSSPIAKAQSTFAKILADSAFTLTYQVVNYVPNYMVIPYPNGDVPAHTGVCSDVVIRAYRKLGIDLQKEVHIDMVKNFALYPNIWGLKHPDSNIDHRRVPNLMTFFKRHGSTLPISQNPSDYVPGDIVCWNLSGGITHIGLVSNQLANDGRTYKIIHNIGNGQVIENCLFDFKIIGHFQYSK